MLTESFIAATQQVRPVAAHLPAALKDVGVFQYNHTASTTLRQGLKKSSSAPYNIAISPTHIFAAQADKAILHVYNREKGNQEASVPFPERISCLAYAEKAAVLVLGTVEGRLILWELATGRITTSAASHVEPVSVVTISPDGRYILSGSKDASIHVWNLAGLLSFNRPQATFGNEKPANEPDSTFNHHRGAINILAHSHATHSNSTFIVSASSDKTLYIWSLSTLTVLRTILLPSSPNSIALDPVNRAIYIGTEDGSISYIDLYSNNPSHTSVLTEDHASASVTQAVKSSDMWRLPATTDAGAVQCLTLSYDGTTLLSGHPSGAVLKWDVAKRRVIGEVVNLSNQSVTNIFMLRPAGFVNEQHAKFEVPNVVKPRLDLSSNDGPSASGIPTDYTLHVRVTGNTSQNCRSADIDDIDEALNSNSIPESMLSAALNAIYSRDTSAKAHQSNGGTSTSHSLEKPQPSTLSDTEILQLDHLQKENASIKAQLEQYRKAQVAYDERRKARQLRGEEVGLQKREAFFAAKKAGRDGDVAMRPFMATEEEIDDESDGDGAEVNMTD